MISARFTALALALGFVGLAGATPVAAPTCTPNFQGHAQTVYKQPDQTDIGVYEWRPTSNEVGSHITLVQTPVNTAFAADEFIVEFTGQPNNTFNFKLVADTQHTLLLSGFPAGDLFFAAPGFANPSQAEFSISCASCPDTSDPEGDRHAKDCVIKNSALNLCVTDPLNGVEETLRLAPCDGSSTQTYSFWEGFSP